MQREEKSLKRGKCLVLFLRNHIQSMATWYGYKVRVCEKGLFPKRRQEWRGGWGKWRASAMHMGKQASKPEVLQMLKVKFCAHMHKKKEKN